MRFPQLHDPAVTPAFQHGEHPMRSRIKVLIIGLLVAAGGFAVACSSSDPVPDNGAAGATDYDSVGDSEDDSEETSYEEYESAEQPPSQGPDQPPMGQEPAADVPEAVGPVATVNGEEIPAERFNEQMEQEVALMQQQFGQVPPEFLGQIQNELINHLVQEHLLLTAIDEADVEVSDEEVDERVDAHRQEFEESPQAQMDDTITFEDVLAHEGLSLEDFRDIIETQVELETMLEERGMELPTDEDVRQYYDENPEEFTVPESVESEILMVAVTAADEEAWEASQSEAQEIRAEAVEEDLTLEEVAEQRGDHVMSQQAPIERDLPPQPEGIEEAAFDELEDGQISEPIRTQQGWILIRRIEHQDEHVRDFDEVQNQIEHQLHSERMGDAVEGLIAELREDATIELHPENIQ